MTATDPGTAVRVGDGRTAHPDVYSPIDIGPVRVANRLFQAPHGSVSRQAPPAYGLDEHVYARDPVDGSPLPHPDVIDYYEERARGGLGLIIQGHIEVQKGDSGRWHLTTDSAVAAFEPLVARVHQHGTKIFAQLHCGFGSPSGIPGAGFVGSGFPRPLAVGDIERIVGLVGVSARGALRAGFDGVELHAAHLHSTGLFLSGFTNRRTDRYGGSVEGRMRFAVECLRAIRDAVGGEVAVGIRLPCDEQLPEGIDGDEAREIAERFEDLGLLDFFDLDIGHSQHMWHLFAPHHIPASYEVPYIARVREVIRDAVVLGCPGRLQSPTEAQRIIGSGLMDMVGGVRGLFADPEYARKGLELREEEIRPCIGLSSCVFEGQCVMNPANYLEALYGTTKLVPADTPRRLVVVGGGPAGMEAARVAARRGHDVVLLERDPVLGGALNLQAQLPTRQDAHRATAWWEGELERLGVDVRPGVEATAELVEELHPDVVALATGATFDRSGTNGLTGRPVPGWDLPFVHTPETLLPSVPDGVRRAVVCDDDGAITASDVAWLLAGAGAEVWLVTRHAATAQGYIGRFGSHRDVVNGHLHRLGVHILADTFVREVRGGRRGAGPGQVTLFDVHDDREQVVGDVDLVVVVAARHPRDGLAGELRQRGLEVAVLGDAAQPGRMAKATRDGFLFGWEL